MASAEQRSDRTELREMCESLGYHADLRQEDYPVWQGQLHGDIVCFTDRERYDMATAAIVAGTSSGDRGRTRHFEVSEALAAPICVLHHETQWELWGMSARDGRPARLPSPAGRPDQDPAVIRFLAPEALAAAKRDEIQLPLFDFDLGALTTQRERAAAILDKRVRTAVAELLPNPDVAETTELETAARLVVQALAALAIRDKLVPDRSLSSALSIVEERLTHRAVASPDDVIRVAERLGEGLNFKALDPSLLGDVYERAVLVPTSRLALGAYYTPPEIGRLIVDHLPVEEITPENRRFADPSCGSGSLLLAASDRLVTALPASTSMRSGQEYARERLFGSDRDPFAVELTRLALFLQALPYGNGFRVEQRDALDPVDDGTSQPTFVVSNPPWSWERADGKRRQLADAFLRALVNRVEPGGFVGCVLPVGWLTSDTDRASREWLRGRADVFEVWRLPMYTFRTGKMAPCVIFARVNEVRGATYVFRNVWSSDRKALQSDGRFSQWSIVQRSEGDREFTAHARIGEQLQGTVPLGSVAHIRDGAPTNSVADVGSHGGDLRFLAKYSDVGPFGRVTDDVLRPCRYPEDFSKRGAASRPDDYLHPKVLVSAMSTVDSPWRLQAFLDDLSVIPRNSMYSIVPNENSATARLALLGILSSALASLWVADRTATRMIHASTLAQLPVPPRDRWEPIADATRDAVDGQRAGADLTEVVRTLEQVVLEAYAASSSIRAGIAEAFAGTRAPEGVVRYQAAPDSVLASPTAADIAPGSIVAVDGGSVKLHVPGHTQEEGSWMPLPRGLPGWLARAGATFVVRGASSGLERATYHFQEYSWMTLDDLLAEASNG
ncbi:MAG TPA: N-6 DNA methylase [Baekduia sp.]|uniref:N-6 DNA methylase n=1 Tax=Baekduia sp. TaxID=2600305 RepID=UPI002C02F080|nr:N-6 DNA methylase [Baekduia sp.]HMJ32626.1 N-6 DNA methylase [Baekduia sp.]